MKKTFYTLIAAVMLVSLVLTACGGGTTPVVEETATEVEVEVEEPTEAPEPTAVPTEPAPAGAEVLDEEFGAMLEGMKKYNTIFTEDLLVEMASDAPPFILDVRSAGEVEESGYIEGATHIPLNELAQHPELLPDYDTPIVTYCKGGWRATIAMTALHNMGWNDVRALKVPFAEWKEGGNPVVEGTPENPELNAVDPDQSKLLAADAYLQGIQDLGLKFGITTAEDLNSSLVENDDLVVIDVRRQEEVDEKGTIDAPNFMHIPLEAFIVQRPEWPGDMETPIAIYCGSGHRSTMAMTMMLAYGYSDVVSLKGGFNGWVDAGYPTVGGAPTLDETYSTMLDNMVAYNTVKSADVLLAEMIEDQPPFILDVRTLAEVEETGHIEGTAAHIPLSELAQNIDQLPAFDTPIVTYCKGGWRATIAMTALHAMGWEDVRALKVGFPDWKEGGNPVAEGVPQDVVLDAAQPASDLVAAADDALSGIKELGMKFGIKTAEALNTDLVEKPDLILIDVRRPEELEEKGVIAVEGQELLAIPLEEFIAQKGMWPADQDAEIVIYCGSGHRSTMAMEIMLSYGYENVTSLKGGFGGWVEAGFPIAEYAAP